MMSEPSNHDAASEDIDGVYPAHAPDHGLERQVKTRFRPWHHPRKQYVRIHQWCSAAQRLIRDLNLGAGDLFRYLTLPGDELLDVRELHGVCELAGVKLRYLGFSSVTPGSSGQTELNLSQSEVSSMTLIDSYSKVVQDRLEAVANDRSPAQRSAREGAPFHAINIDLCGSITQRRDDSLRDGMLAALGKLLELQRKTTEPWLLFITTRALPDLVCPSARAGFMKAIADNAAASPEFQTKLAELVSCSANELDAALGRTWACQDAGFLRLFCAGLGKWLLSLLSSTQEPRELILLSSCYYQVGPAGPDMLSLAFRCSTPRQPMADRYGVLSEPPALAPFSEVNAALHMVQEVCNSKDLDKVLADDPKLAEKLTAQAGRLLATARYDAGAYNAWATQELARQRQPAYAAASSSAR